jgi:hypothetical protein
VNISAIYHKLRLYKMKMVERVHKELESFVQDITWIDRRPKFSTRRVVTIIKSPK